jgi:hypothetical protein
MAGVPLLHVCGSLDPWINDQTRVAEKRYKELGGQITVAASRHRLLLQVQQPKGCDTITADRINWPICGGFFDVPGAQKRLGELNALMAAGELLEQPRAGPGLIDEANGLRNKIEPLLKAEKQLEDFHVMVELGEAEPEAEQAKIQQDLERTWPGSSRSWTAWN